MLSVLVREHYVSLNLVGEIFCLTVMEGSTFLEKNLNILSSSLKLL